MKNIAEAWVQNGTSGVLWWTDKMIFPTSEMPSHSQLSQINQSNRTKSVYSLNYSVRHSQFMCLVISLPSCNLFLSFIKKYAATRNWTKDTGIFSPLLYQLSYCGILLLNFLGVGRASSTLIWTPFRFHSTGGAIAVYSL